MYKKISDYGIIGNLHTIALVALDGSIDWFCYPHIDSPSVFGGLLDSEKGGTFIVQPVGEFDSTAEYLPQTNILVTRFRTRTGTMKVIDFMPIPQAGPEKKEEDRHTLIRILEVERGEIETHLLFMPRFDYARVETRVEAIENGVLAKGNDLSLALTSSRPLQCNTDRATATWTLKAGEGVFLRAGSTGSNGSCDSGDRAPLDERQILLAINATKAYWQNWLGQSETGRTFPLGPYRDMIERSALVLKLLYYGPTGSIAAAPTTSLPEEVGGVRNWDYRFTWVRDSSFTLQALFNLGHVSETEGYLRWIENVLSMGGVDEMQIMYGLRGERDLEEIELPHLDGYKGSRPVRIGNGAAKQRQLDIYGELMDAALKLADYVGKITADQWPVLCEICDYVVNHWQEQDAGIWEVRGGPWNFVYSKVMCWVALDRGVTIAKRYGFQGDLEKWRQTMEAIKAEVLEKGFNPTKKTFVQHYDTDVLDSSNLLMPLLGFLPFDDARVVSTIDATIHELAHDGLLYRYKGEDGLEGEEGTFLLCAFWLVDCLTHLGRLEEAEVLLHKLEKTGNHLGLFSEEYDVKWKEALGNFPQAFTHIGYINSVINLIKAREKSWAREKVEEKQLFSIHDFVHKKVFAAKLVLNEGESDITGTTEDLVAQLKSSMNLLRGAFFDSDKGRVAYERMKDSELYDEYVNLSHCLRHIDPGRLTTLEEKIAFWINLYNVQVVHGVVALDVKDSVKEVRNFFRRIRYDVGGHFFTPDDIEHGIVRGNRKPPHILFKVFPRGDPRLDFSLKDFEPRIHFALVCASSSCPPIALYTGENLDNELDLAAKTFLTGGGLELDKQAGKVNLSSIFNWYAKDFADNDADKLRWLAQLVHDPAERNFIEQNAESLKIDYQYYDWRLNRY